LSVSLSENIRNPKKATPSPIYSALKRPKTMKPKIKTLMGTKRSNLKQNSEKLLKKIPNQEKTISLKGIASLEIQNPLIRQNHLKKIHFEANLQ
jgi:hypothetical protein